jgi:hypothetical protein
MKGDGCADLGPRADRFLRAIFVMCPPSGSPCQPGAAVDLAEALTRARQTWPRDLDAPVLVYARLVDGIRPAQQVVNLAIACDLRDAKLDRSGRVSAQLDVVTAAITAAASRLSVGLTDFETAISRVRTASTKMTTRLDDVQADGDLRAFNKEFSRRRREAAACGRPFMNYTTARQRLTEVLAEMTSRGVADSDLLFKRVFGN